MSQTLIIGIGNPLRCDDGIGWKIAELLQDEFVQNPEVEVLAVHQLTPELAVEIARAVAVVFIDASVSGLPGAVHVSEISAREAFPALLNHQLDPDDLLAFACGYSGKISTATLISVSGEDFAHGESFSRQVIQSIPLIMRHVRLIVANNIARDQVALCAAK